MRFSCSYLEFKIAIEWSALLEGIRIRIRKDMNLID
jgi:hypothetical protein